MNKIYLILIISVLFCTFVLASDETIAFSAIKGERNGPYISYQILLVNSSAKFNPLYGVFMCSDPGIYYFSFNVLSHQESDLRVSLRTNRIPVVTAYSGSKTSYNMASGTAILQLEPNDIVYCFIEDGDFYESKQVNRAYTSFSGFKIGSNQSGGGFLSSLMARRSTIRSYNNNNKDKLENNGIDVDANDNIYVLLNNSTLS